MTPTTTPATPITLPTVPDKVPTMLSSTKTLGDLLEREPVVVMPTTTLLGACKVLAEEVVGLVLVADHARLRGVLSERDIVRALAEGADPANDRVGEWMTEEICTLDVTTSVRDALEALVDNQIRHVVVTKGTQPLGVVSERALADAALKND